MTTLSPAHSAPINAARDFLVYVNGELVPQQDAVISVFDSGLNFADGVFEGIRVYGGRVLHLEHHIKRLYESANAFEISIGMTPAAFTDAILGWLRANGISDGFHFRPIVTRGNRMPPRLDPRFCTGSANIIIVGGPIAPASMRGQRVVISSVRQINSDAIDARIKSLNYGNNLLARLEAVRRGVDDALMLDSQGFLAEASAANTFLVKEGELLTPFAKACLDGITRRSVIDMARRRKISVVERDLSFTEIINADEVFLTGTGTELVPVIEVEGRTIGSGAAGEITTALYADYMAMVATEGVPVPAT
ncbi:MAG: aminotransferase class IV [Candidatus Dormibacteria bacterium]